VTEESFNHPLGFLAAQFAALLSESNAFSTVLATLLSVLDKDTTLIDQLLAEAGLRSWASTIPLLTGGASILVGLRRGLRADHRSRHDLVVDRSGILLRRVELSELWRRRRSPLPRHYSRSLPHRPPGRLDKRAGNWEFGSAGNKREDSLVFRLTAQLPCSIGCETCHCAIADAARGT
jgi:hypothetical protein